LIHFNHFKMENEIYITHESVWYKTEDEKYAVILFNSNQLRPKGDMVKVVDDLPFLDEIYSERKTSRKPSKLGTALRIEPEHVNETIYFVLFVQKNDEIEPSGKETMQCRVKWFDKAIDDMLSQIPDEDVVEIAFPFPLCCNGNANSNQHKLFHETILHKIKTTDRTCNFILHTTSKKVVDPETATWEMCSLREYISNCDFKEWSTFFESERVFFETVSDQLTKVEDRIFPEIKNVFRLFREIQPNQIRVVIIGQDPYFNVGKATGLAFSVPESYNPLPPSLANIFKEVKNCYPDSGFSNGDLTHWVKQGVFLLNRTLTVSENKANSHVRIWEGFAERLVKRISREQEHLVFMLWGNNAKYLKKYIVNPTQHLILESVHPSGLSASKGFFGCMHFKKCNEYLEKNNKPIINW
jgi:uracil-DNA glycosylase